jgi:hypothetical protein
MTESNKIKECPNFSIDPDRMNLSNIPENRICPLCINRDNCNKIKQYYKGEIHD